MARDLPHDTTSVVAGALWGPSFQEPMARTMAWTNRSLTDFTALAEDPASGVRMARTLTVGAMPAGDPPPQARSIPELRACDPAELPPGFASGFHSVMPLADMPRCGDLARSARGSQALKPASSLPALLTRSWPISLRCSLSPDTGRAREHSTT